MGTDARAIRLQQFLQAKREEEYERMGTQYSEVRCAERRAVDVVMEDYKRMIGVER